MHAKRCDATATPKTHTAARTVVAGGHAGPVWHVAFAGPSMVFGAPLHALVVFRDGVTAVVAGRTTVWQREEALAHIRHVEFVDLPKKSVLLEGAPRTPDLGGTATTSEVTDAVIAALAARRAPAH